MDTVPIPDDFLDPPTAAELEALRAKRVAEQPRRAEEARIAEEDRIAKEKREHLLTERTRYCKRFAKCDGRSFFFTCECSGDTMKDVKSEAAVARIREAFNPNKWGDELRSAIIGVVETGGRRTIQMALDLKAGHTVPADKVMTAVHSAFLDFDGEIRFSPDATPSTFAEKARRILAPSGPEPVDVDPCPFVYRNDPNKSRNDTRDPVYVQLQRIQNLAVHQRGSKRINLYHTWGMDSAFINNTNAVYDVDTILRGCEGSWKKLMSTILFAGEHRGNRNPLLFRVCFDLLSRPPTPGETVRKTYERFVQEKVYGIWGERPPVPPPTSALQFARQQGSGSGAAAAPKKKRRVA